MSEKGNKNYRILHLYQRLCSGRLVRKSEEASFFHVDERTIQRDINDIRAFLAEEQVGDTSDTREIIYDRKQNGFLMTGLESTVMSNSEILAISEILLESRAFTKHEINMILDKLIAGCVPLKNMKLVSGLIANEKYHYVELHHKSCIKDKLWELGEEVKQCNLLELTYQKQVDSTDVVKRVVEPVAVLFSEYYFYLNAYIVEKNERGIYTQLYDYPAIFRLDRIQSYREIGEKFNIAYSDRFEEGEFRKRIQFMFAGKLTKIRFRYTGNSVEAILDRLPTAKVIQSSEQGHEVIVEAEVYGKGILMWLLSQGNRVEVLKPEALREEMRETLESMLRNYM